MDIEILAFYLRFLVWDVQYNCDSFASQGVELLPIIGAGTERVLNGYMVAWLYLKYNAVSLNNSCVDIGCHVTTRIKKQE